jgi:hypothetical protein
MASLRFETLIFLPGSGPERTTLPALRVKEVMAIPWSRAYFCPTCGQIWARVVTPPSLFHVYVTPCENHPQSPFIVAGSIWDPLDRDFNEALPLSTITREFALHCAHYDRYGPAR